MPGEEDELLFVEHVVTGQRQLQRLQFGLAIAVFVVGIALLLAAQLWLPQVLSPDGLKELVSIGGGFVASLSSLPLKQLYDRRLKIGAIELLLKGMQQKAAGQMAPEEAAAIQERFNSLWDLGLAS